MSVHIESTTDSEENMQAAMGQKHEKAEDVEEPAESSDGDENKDASATSEETASGDESEAEESDKSDGDESEESEEKLEAKPKKKQGFKRRIDKLNSKLSQKEMEAEFWRQEALKLRGDETKKEVVAETKTERPDPDTYDTHEDYLDALADWKLETKLKAIEQKTNEQKLREAQIGVIEDFQKRVQAFAKTHDDFDEVISEVDDIPMSLTVQEVVLSSSNGHELMYELAKSRDEYAAICQMTPIEAAKALGRFEEKIASKKHSQKETKTETKKITKAPKPLEPLGAKGGAGSAKSVYDPNLSYREFEALRKKQLAEREQNY